MIEAEALPLGWQASLNQVTRNKEKMKKLKGVKFDIQQFTRLFFFLSCQLVTSYLVHHGYRDAALAFAREAQVTRGKEKKRKNAMCEEQHGAFGTTNRNNLESRFPFMSRHSRAFFLAFFFLPSFLPSFRSPPLPPPSLPPPPLLLFFFFFFSDGHFGGCGSH